MREYMKKMKKITNIVSTLLGLTARCRFSIHLSLSEAERQAKHLVPELVVTCRHNMQLDNINISAISV